jgi:hypothetical protein
MFPEAVARYHDLLSNQDLAESSRALLDDVLENARLIFGGRRLSPYLRPHFVSESDFAHICQICETVWSAIQKVKDAAVADPHVVDDLGLSEIERELVAIDPGYVAVSPTSRLDSFLTKSSYSFVELNGESPAGIAYADAAYDIFSSLPVMKEFAADYNVRAMYGRGLMLNVLVSSYEEFLGRNRNARHSSRSWIYPAFRPSKSSSFSATTSNNPDIHQSSAPHRSWSSATAASAFAGRKSTSFTSVCS